MSVESAKPADAGPRMNPQPRPAGCAPGRAMVLAAGLGTRLRPMTDTAPKPLIEVAGETLLDRALDRLEDAGVETVIVNVHYRAEQIEAHVKNRQSPKIEISREETLLDTGGGVAKALPLLGDEPFYVINGDSLWLNGYGDALTRMARSWDDERMDGLLLLHATVDAYGYSGLGDFIVDPLGALQRRPELECSPYLFSGIQLLHPRLFTNTPTGAFSLNRLYDDAIDKGRLYGVVHDGEWFHVGTVDGLAEAEAYLQARYAGTRRR